MQRLREKFQQVRSVLLLGIPSARKQHIAHFLYRSATCTLKIPFCREILADILARILLFLSFNIRKLRICYRKENRPLWLPAISLKKITD